jgi:hypothetical protein
MGINVSLQEYIDDFTSRKNNFNSFRFFFAQKNKFFEYRRKNMTIEDITGQEEIRLKDFGPSMERTFYTLETKRVCRISKNSKITRNSIFNIIVEESMNHPEWLT